MNVNSPEFISNPYPFYDKRRSENPAFKRDDTTWTLTGYEIISKVLAHSAIGRGNVGQKPRPHGDTSEISEIRDDNLALQIMDQWMLFQNPPEHTISRKRISNVFTIKMIEQFEGLMRSVLRKQIATIKETYSENQQFDLIKNIAYPYPVNVICEMIGIPEEDQAQFSQWTRDFSLAVQLDFINIDDKLRSRLNQTAYEVKEYFETLIDTKKQHGGDDLICRLIDASEGSMTHMQLVSNCIFLLFAGQETTTLMISNMVYSLLKHPDQLELLRSKPELSKNAVEECLRYDPSIQMIGRFALEEIEIGGLKIKKGDHIFAFLAAAGYDPDANSNPHTFDITRDKVKHVAFARGAHHCLGASLARLELRVFLEELLGAFPYLSLTSNSTRRPTWLIRGFDALPLTYRNTPLKKDEKRTIKLGSGLYPFSVQELHRFTFQDYQLENVFENISDEQRHACVKMWMKHKVLPTKELAWERSKQVCYIFTDLKNGDVIGVNTLYQSQFENSNQSYFFNRMYILPEYRNSRLMITGTAAMLCYAKTHLSERDAVGVINVNENKKLDRPGLQGIFNRLGYRHKEWKDNKEVILFEFDKVSYF